MSQVHLPTWDDISNIPMVCRYECWRETVVADGTPMAQATDWSGNGNHAIQATGAQQPLYKQNICNNLPSYRFDGVNDVLVTGSIPAMNNTLTRWYYLFYTVPVSYTTSTPVGAFWRMGNTAATGGDGDLEYWNGSSLVLRQVANGAGFQDVPNAQPFVLSTAYCVDSEVLDGANNTMRWANANINATRTELTPAPNGTATLYLGSYNAGAALPAALDLLAFFCGNTAISAADQARVKNYFLTIAYTINTKV